LELATSIQTYSPTESINQTKKSIEILERINSGEQWRGYWTLAKIQSSISTKLVSEKEIIETLEKTVALLDAIRNQFDLSVYEEISRYEESTKTFSKVAKKLASIYEKNGDLQKSKNLNSSWKII
jgi:DNA polymerase II large subunit